MTRKSIKTLCRIGWVFSHVFSWLGIQLRKLRQVGSTALIAAGLEILLMVWVGYESGAVVRLGAG